MTTEKEIRGLIKTYPEVAEAYGWGLRDAEAEPYAGADGRTWDDPDLNEAYDLGLNDGGRPQD